jgi:hypothetical protein
LEFFSNLGPMVHRLFKFFRPFVGHQGI